MESFDKNAAFSEVIGKNPEAVEFIKDQLHEDFIPQKFSFEREKTEEEKALIEAVLEKFPEFVRSYGAEAIPITLDHIHIIDKKKLDEITDVPEDQKELFELLKEDKIAGSFYSNLQQIIIFADNHNSKIALVDSIAHELIHAHSYISFDVKEIDENTLETKNRRIGIAMKSREDSSEGYFTFLDEAIVMELEKRFHEKYTKNIEIVKDEVEQTDNIKKDLIENYGEDEKQLKNVVSIVPHSTIENNFFFETFAYSKESKLFHKIVDEIYEKNKDGFSSPEDVITLFIQAHVTGRVLELARLYEGTFGKGSFAKLGEKTMDRVSEKES